MSKDPHIVGVLTITGRERTDQLGRLLGCPELFVWLVPEELLGPEATSLRAVRASPL